MNEDTEPSLTVAVVGSGASGCYLAQSLVQKIRDIDITIIERLPTPYGLIRYGVAPDHQGTKTPVRQFEKMFQNGSVRFLGNIEVGRDLSLDELREMFDVVVLATGMTGDRRLAVPGHDLRRVYGAGQVTRWLNEHPDAVDFEPHFGEQVAIVGNGNVAIDILRLLIKKSDSYDRTDFAHDIRKTIEQQGITQITIVGRSRAADAKFHSHMIRELAGFDHVRYETDPAALVGDTDIAAASVKLEALRELGVPPLGTESVTVRFLFGWVPECVHGVDSVEFVDFVAADGSGCRLRVDADSVVTAIGFEERDGATLRRSEFEDTTSDLAQGFLGAGLFCVGWFRNGPQGGIPEARKDAKMVATSIEKMVIDGMVSTGRAGFDALPISILAKGTNYHGWSLIDRHETGAADGGLVRRKIRDLETLIQVARSEVPPESRS